MRPIRCSCPRCARLPPSKTCSSIRKWASRESLYGTCEQAGRAKGTKSGRTRKTAAVDPRRRRREPNRPPSRQTVPTNRQPPKLTRNPSRQLQPRQSVQDRFDQGRPAKDHDADRFGQEAGGETSAKATPPKPASKADTSEEKMTVASTRLRGRPSQFRSLCSPVSSAPQDFAAQSPAARPGARRHRRHYQ